MKQKHPWIADGNKCGCKQRLASPWCNLGRISARDSCADVLDATMRVLKQRLKFGRILRLAS